MRNQWVKKVRIALNSKNFDLRLGPSLTASYGILLFFLLMCVAAASILSHWCLWFLCFPLWMFYRTIPSICRIVLSVLCSFESSWSRCLLVSQLAWQCPLRVNVPPYAKLIHIDPPLRVNVLIFYILKNSTFISQYSCTPFLRTNQHNN